MQLPQINLNGTHPESLARQYYHARTALLDARSLLTAAGPHGRDYQTLPAGAWTLAVEEHIVRVAALDTVIRDLEILVDHCLDAAIQKDAL